MSDLPSSEAQEAIGFSVVVPAYNAAKYLDTCLQSLRTQGFEHWECIIVDDGSTDDSASIAQRYVGEDSRFQLLRQKNCGPSEARNLGISRAKYPWIAFLDADDRFLPTTLQRYFEAVVNHCLPTHNVRIVCGHYCADPREARASNEHCVLDLFLSNTYIGYRAPLLPSASVVAAECFRVGGMFSSKGILGLEGGGEDLEFWSRMTSVFRVVELKSTVAIYRQDKPNSRNEVLKKSGKAITVHREVLERHAELPDVARRLKESPDLKNEYFRRKQIALALLGAAQSLHEGGYPEGAAYYTQARENLKPEERLFVLALWENLIAFPVSSPLQCVLSATAPSFVRGRPVGSREHSRRSSIPCPLPKPSTTRHWSEPEVSLQPGDSVIRPPSRFPTTFGEPP